MSDWPSYDGISERYDDAWGSRFEEVARHIGERVTLPRGSSVLDIGSGTGIVLDALGSRARDGTRLIGCDKSAGMIRVARRRVPAGRFALGNAVMLPFRSCTFDAAAASFVLSHLPDCEAGLAEARRVLKPGGVFVMTSWSTDTDDHGESPASPCTPSRWSTRSPWTTSSPTARSAPRVVSHATPWAPARGHASSPALAKSSAAVSVRSSSAPAAS